MSGDDIGSCDANSVLSVDDVFTNRVERPKLLKVESTPRDDHDASVLKKLMKGKKTDWKRAKNAAAKILDPEYTCKAFFEDITAAFPELRLYCLETEGGEDLVSSGRTADDEYQRTIGALFATFWIMRLDLDGKESFCFGLNDKWLPFERDSAALLESCRGDSEDVTKRGSFFEAIDWKSIQQLLLDAGLLKFDVVGHRVHDQERTLAMLVMMVTHDIMKLTPLLPKVGRGKSFNGYKAGEVIGDHDMALSYVLTYHAELLPSFTGLPKAQQESIRFCHCKMDYNMGWLVQAEAPPGALFQNFKKVATSGQVKETDVAFYFVHWFVDLAGAEPCPISGCTKFVLKFPQRVLAQFLDSFSVVQAISIKAETDVLEDYFRECWYRHDPELGPAPQGSGTIARMRLMLMAQGDTLEILKQFQLLSIDEQTILSQEMACTGCKGQQFSTDDLKGQPTCGKGPAILVYYGPALMQKAGKKDPKSALRVLAEVYRRTRELWPLTEDAADQSITVRIDALKEIDSSLIQRPDSGQIWVISKMSSKDSMVKLVAASEYKDIDWKNNVVLQFQSKDTKSSKSTSNRLKLGVGGIGTRVRRFGFLGGSVGGD